MPRLLFLKWRRVLGAERQLRVGASGVKGAARRWCQRCGDVPFQEDSFFSGTLVNLGHCRDEGFGIRVQEPGKNGLAFAAFNDFPQIHDDNSVTHMPYNGKVMGYNEKRKGKFRFQLMEEIDDLRLHGEVECRYRLVGDDEARRHGKCACNAYSLTLSARKLVRVSMVLFFRQADLVHEVYDCFPVLLFAGQAMYRQRLADYVSDPHSRVE